MPLLNFTNRDDIERNLIEIVVDETSATLVVFLKTKQTLRESDHYVGCCVVLEAYMGMKAQRNELGAIEKLASSTAVRFEEFSPTEKPSFRLKIVEPGTKRIAGIVEGLHPNNEPRKEEDANWKPLLPVRWANESDNMRHRFWKVGLDGPHPILLLQRGKFTALGEVNQPEFQALAFPQILTEILTNAFVVHFANPPSWSENWERLVERLGAEPRPVLEQTNDGTTLSPAVIEDHLDSVRIWIDQVSDLYAADRRLMRIDSQFKCG